MSHRWSGWPGAWCLDCGKEDPMERILADGLVDDDMRPLPGALTEDDMKPCAEPGSKRHDPYARRLTQ
jgi:hypothetical protein